MTILYNDGRILTKTNDIKENTENYYRTTKI